MLFVNDRSIVLMSYRDIQDIIMNLIESEILNLC